MLGNGAAKAPGVLMMKKGEVRQVGTWTFEAVASLSTARDPQCRTQSSNVDDDSNRIATHSSDVIRGDVTKHIKIALNICKCQS